MWYINKEQQQTLINKQIGSSIMKHQNPVELQAIMNLLYIGNQEDTPDFNQTLATRQFAVLNDHQNKIKSNTIHLRNHKNGLHSHNLRTQSTEQCQSFKKNTSDNKENLKKLLQKWQNTPSPPPRKKEQAKKKGNDRVQTQNAQPQSLCKRKGFGNKSLQLTKKSLDMFFDKKKDRDFIKSLIKAKIIEKLRRVEVNKNQKKVYSFGNNTQNFRAIGCKTLKSVRPTIQTSSKSKQKSNVLNILWEQKKVTKPTVSRKNSRVNLKQLLF